MPVAFDFDYLKPDYGKVFRDRLIKGRTLSDPDIVAGLKAYYKLHPWQFINDWGCTYDPRNADIGLPTLIPFILYEKQEEWIKWVLTKWRNREPGINDKSRDMGVTWLLVALSVTLCLFNRGIAIGVGSRKLDLVDRLGDPDCIFWKARKFLEYLPTEFTSGFALNRDAPYCKIIFRETESTITGEGGDGIGRGGRKSIYFVDESAYIEHPELIDASLSNNTNCRIDVSSAHGMGNSFAQRRHSGKIDVFTMHWREDPRKNPNHRFLYKGMMVNWYEKMEYDLDPVTLAQEVDINYAASIDGVVIPHEWVKSAIGAAEKLGITVTGARSGALDVADQGKDLNAFVARYGIEIIYAHDWSGKGSDTLYTTEQAFLKCDELDLDHFQYDADGIGTSVRGDSRMINERRKQQKERHIEAVAFRGSGEVLFPEKEVIKGQKNSRKNKDFFMNRKAQAWWHARTKFQNTFRAINGQEYDKEEIISISPELKNLHRLTMELSQAVYTITTSGKILIDKTPEGTKSPNLGDAAIIALSPAKRSMGLFSTLPSGKGFPNVQAIRR